jgi:hypothetical protein
MRPFNFPVAVIRFRLDFKARPLEELIERLKELGIRTLVE